MKTRLTLLTLLVLLVGTTNVFAQTATTPTAEDACFAHNGNLDENGHCIVQSGISIKIDYPLELAARPLMATSADRWITDQRQQFVSQWLTDGQSPSPAPWEMDIGYQLYWHSSNIQSIQLENYAYTGGAHGGNILQTYTFDLANNRLLALEDLFQPGTDILGTLQAIARASIRAQLGDGTDETWLSDGTSNLDAFRHFVIDGDTLVITFDQYQVGPYAVGNLSFSVPLGDLSTLLAPALGT